MTRNILVFLPVIRTILRQKDRHLYMIFFWQAAVTQHQVFVVPTIQFFALTNRMSEKCPVDQKPAPWKRNNHTYDLVGSSIDTNKELKEFVMKTLSVEAGVTQQEAKWTSRSVPANLLEESWDDIYKRFQRSLDKANGSKQPIRPHELVRDRAITYHHRAGLNNVLSEVSLFVQFSVFVMKCFLKTKTFMGSQLFRNAEL